MSKKAVLFLNGEITSLPALKSDEQIYCTDGAYNYLQNSGMNISAVIGDFDSVNCHVPENIAVVRYDQNYTDFEKALWYFIAQHFDSVDIYFASGGEMDHFLGNLSVAKKFFKSIKLKFIDQYHNYFMLDSELEIKNVKGKIISILPFPEAVVSSCGLVYEMNNYIMRLGEDISCRNKAEKDNVTIKVLTGQVIVYVANKAVDI